MNFNPRSLAGATTLYPAFQRRNTISIHAPLRERPHLSPPTDNSPISIHAPLRERRGTTTLCQPPFLFQSTLPCGSDYDKLYDAINHDISIHAPLRERQLVYQ